MWFKSHIRFICQCNDRLEAIFHTKLKLSTFDCAISYGISIRFQFASLRIFVIIIIIVECHAAKLNRSLAYGGWRVGCGLICCERIQVNHRPILKANSIVRFRISKLLANGRVTRYSCNCHRVRESGGDREARSAHASEIGIATARTSEKAELEVPAQQGI